MCTRNIDVRGVFLTDELAFLCTDGIACTFYRANFFVPLRVLSTLVCLLTRQRVRSSVRGDVLQENTGQRRRAQITHPLLHPH